MAGNTTDWQLGIDFGTSYTTAASWDPGGEVTILDLEADGRPRMASAVLLASDGQILVGAAALSQAVFNPDRFERTPKRLVGEEQTFLGEGMVPVEDLVQAVIRRAYSEAVRRHGGNPPAATQITHPVEWADSRLDVLRRAAHRAGAPAVTLVPEPVAAAARIAMARTAPGDRIAVYDFGGGTFDAAVLRRTADGFEIAGPPSGRDPLGGEDIDRRIIDYLGEMLPEDARASWQTLLDPPDVAWRRANSEFRAEVQRSKETLSEATACQMWVPGVERQVQLSRRELEDLIHDTVDETVEVLGEAIAAAGTTPQELAGIYLVGGSSRIPLVAQTIWRRLGVRPTVQDDPKGVVAAGAAQWHADAARPPVVPGDAKPPPKPAGGGWPPKKIAVAVLIPLVIVGAVLGVVLSGGHHSPGRTSTTVTTHHSTSTTTPTTPTTPTTTPSTPGAAAVLAAKLTTTVPAALTASCRKLTMKSLHFAGLKAGVGCGSTDADGNNLEVQYERFSTVTDLTQAFDDDTSTAGATTNVGNCSTDSVFPSECGWNYNGVTSGLLAYYVLTSSSDSGSFVEWTIDTQTTLAIAYTSTLSDPALRTWWTNCGGKSGTAVDQSCRS